MSTDTTTPGAATTSKTKTIALWVVTALLAGLFLFAGTMKFAASEAAEQFAQLGYADWFRVLIGGLEIAGGLGLLLPRTARYAAVGLGVVMIGAVGTLLRVGAGGQAVVPFVVLVLLAVVAYARWPRSAR